MKKILLSLLFVGLFFGTMKAQDDATISADQIQYWIGEGSNQAILIVSWCSPEVALAWGFRFENSTLLVSEMMDSIAAADPRFTYEGGGGTINNIFYHDEEYDLSMDGDFPMYNVNSLMAQVGYESQEIVNGDVVKWGGYACGIFSEDWSSCAWTTPVLPVSSLGGSDTTTTDTVIVDTTKYDGAVGTEGCQAIFCQDPAILGWATNCQIERGLQDITVPNVFVSYGAESDAVGAATESTMDVVSLGDSGVAILTFDIPIQNGDGYDFAIFENSLNDSFLELAFVEVSSDGVNYVRFPAVSNTPADVQIDNNGGTDPRDLHNLAGKYRVGWGTPFDLDELADNELLDVNNVTHVKLIDVIGSIDPAVASRDKNNHIINDPYPTNFASGGFDLDGVCVLNGWTPGQTSVSEYETKPLSVHPNPCTANVTVETVLGETVVLYNSVGTELMRVVASEERMTVNMSAYPAGIYFIQQNGRVARIVKM